MAYAAAASDLPTPGMPTRTARGDPPASARSSRFTTACRVMNARVVSGTFQVLRVSPGPAFRVEATARSSGRRNADTTTHAADTTATGHASHR